MRLFHDFLHINRATAVLTVVPSFLQMSQILYIPFRTLDRRKFQMTHVKCNTARKMKYPFDHFPVDRRISHNPFFPNLLAPRLKLRLDQRHDLPVWRQQVSDRTKHLFQRNKRHINRRKGRMLRQLFRSQLTNIRPFHTDYARIIS